MSAQDDAKALVDQFAARTGATIWLGLNRADVAAGLKERIDTPNKVNQSVTSLCGPAALVRTLAQNDPVTYAKLGISLFETGIGSIGKYQVKPGTDLKKNASPVGNDINQADWLILASIRDTDNWWFDYQSTGDTVAAMTLPHSMEKWFKAAGYTTIVNETNLVANKDVRNLRTASKYFSDGYKVCLFINADMLKTATQDDASVFPDHWVCLSTAITITGISEDPASTVSLKIYTWGNEQSVPASGTKPLSIKHFLSNYYGFIACKN